MSHFKLLTDKPEIDRLAGFSRQVRPKPERGVRGVKESRRAMQFSEIFNGTRKKEEISGRSQRHPQREKQEEKDPIRHATQAGANATSPLQENSAQPPHKNTIKETAPQIESESETEKEGLDIRKNDSKALAGLTSQALERPAEEVSSKESDDAAVFKKMLIQENEVTKTNIEQSLNSQEVLLEEQTGDLKPVANDSDNRVDSASDALLPAKTVAQVGETAIEPVDRSSLGKAAVIKSGQSERPSNPSESSPELSLVSREGKSATGSDQQSGMGGGDDFSGSPLLHFSPALKGVEGAGEIQQSESTFSSLLDAGFEIPDEGAILRQVSHQIRGLRFAQNELRSDQNKSIRFFLEPKELGALKIDVLVREGAVIAHIVTSDPHVKALLENQQAFLRDGFKGQGLHIEQFLVDLGDRKSFFDDKKDRNLFKKDFDFSRGVSEIDPLEPVSHILKRGESLVNFYI